MNYKNQPQVTHYPSGGGVVCNEGFNFLKL